MKSSSDKDIREILMPEFVARCREKRQKVSNYFHQLRNSKPRVPLTDEQKKERARNYQRRYRAAKYATREPAPPPEPTNFNEKYWPK